MYYSANKDNFFTNKFKKKDNHIFIPSTSKSPEECIIAEANNKECYDFMTEKKYEYLLYKKKSKKIIFISRVVHNYNLPINKIIPINNNYRM